jgi:predicted O-methyltransferase YrrM
MAPRTINELGLSVRWRTHRALQAGRSLARRVDGAAAPKLLRHYFPDIAAMLTMHDAAMEALAAEHEDYTSTISSPDMAVSLETAAVLRCLAHGYPSHQILDLGSGFSTYALAAATHTKVVSYDDNRGWLDKTASYLSARGVDNVELRSVGEPFPQGNGIVFLDLGLTPRRIGYFAEAAASLAPRGILVIDDLHHQPYGSQVRIGAIPNGLQYFSLRSLTTDSFGRYSALAVKTV